MNELKERARRLLKVFKGDDYVYGVDCLKRAGPLASSLGNSCLLITNLDKRSEEDFSAISKSLHEEKLSIVGPVRSAKPNAPREDVERLAEEVKVNLPDCVVVVAGGSGIDAAKAAVVLSVLGGDIEDYFGEGKVTEGMTSSGQHLIPLLAVQTASGSAAHLTKYSNITDFEKAQKKLIVDDAVVPPKALFDYRLTQTVPSDLTLDGAFDGMAHCLEVFYGASPEMYEKIEEIALTGMELIISSVEKVSIDCEDIEVREALGLGTDLGGYAIMIGGTSGPHLTSFSLVDVLSHGRACAIMQPYFTVFFAPAIQKQLHCLVEIYEKYGLVDTKVHELKGKDLAKAVADGMIKLAKRLGFPSTLREVPGFSEAHIKRVLEAAKNPQLEMKLLNMPVALKKEMVDDYLGPIFEAASTGDFRLVKNVKKT